MAIPTQRWLRGILAVSAFLAWSGGDLAAQDLDWARRAGGSGGDFAFGIATDGAGNSYVTGVFSGTATFGAGEANETLLTSAGSTDIFVASYDANGTLIWTKRAGSADTDQGAGIATNGTGNAYVTGAFSGTATFGPGEANETTLTAAGPLDFFVAKYDATGALIWAKRADGTDVDRGLGISADSAGNSYVTGSFSGTITFGPGEVNQTTLAAAGSSDIFVARYDPGGALIWATRAGGTGLDDAEGIATDGAGNSYVTGRFSGTATFGAGETSETTLTSAGDFDIFVASYDPSGALVWVKRAGGGTGALGWGIATDAAGNSYITGGFSGMATFGAGEPNETLLSGGSEDIFVARYAASGALVWAKRAGGGSGARGLSVAMDSAGNSYVSGAFEGTATFGPGEVNETTLTSAGAGSDDGDPSDIFVASYDFSGALVWAKQAGSADVDQGLAIATDSTSNAYVTGYFGGAATFGPGEANETTLTSAGEKDLFIAGFSGVADTDGDGIADGDDNCPDDVNANQLDTDGDGDGDACDDDDDDDSVADAGDNCPLDANSDQADADGDGAGDACDADLDGDGVIDAADACVPTQTGTVVDADGCSIADLVPCTAPWKNHGAYVSTIVKTAKEFLDLGLITEAEKDAIVSAAGQSQCGQ